MSWEEVVNSTFTDHDWLENFPASHSAFLYLCNELGAGVEKQNTIMRRAVSTEKHIAVMWFLATGADYRILVTRYSTVCVITKEACVAIVESTIAH